ncbi:MAG: hypothetical protein JO127_00055 [Caulobacteraceae bacterium]|nr:hypothetical protein [Caulobacteraceae bacterium]
MNKILRGAAAVVLAGALSAPALARPERPDAIIHFHGGSVGFIAGVQWGGGVVDFHGKHYPVQVSGLDVGTIGGSSYEATGEVRNLHRIADIEGTYAAASASATAGPGAGGLDMTNGNGVEIRATSTSTGLKLTAGVHGITIKLKH